ncbi:MAG: hypothetical protein ABI171_03110 [Collimonas sp.]|uniref:hypothetical protein n=1 Tax=Collimonas sp. TaxID=1963772 RepID=UPI00326766E5
MFYQLAMFSNKLRANRRQAAMPDFLRDAWREMQHRCPAFDLPASIVLNDSSSLQGKLSCSIVGGIGMD